MKPRSWQYLEGIAGEKIVITLIDFSSGSRRLGTRLITLRFHLGGDQRGFKIYRQSFSPRLSRDSASSLNAPIVNLGSISIECAARLRLCRATVSQWKSLRPFHRCPKLSKIRAARVGCDPPHLPAPRMPVLTWRTLPSLALDRLNDRMLCRGGMPR